MQVPKKVTTGKIPTAVDWTGLPPELLHIIASNLQTLVDYIRLRAVCKPWRAAPLVAPREFPSLVLKLNRYFNPLQNIRHHFTLAEPPNSCRTIGSSHGWLVLIHNSHSIFVTNPLTSEKITLPPLSYFPNVVKFDLNDKGCEYHLRTPDSRPYYSNLEDMRKNFIKKVILSPSPKDESNFVAFAIVNHFKKLAYCRYGDNSWKYVHQTHIKHIEDVIYFNNAFYVVDHYGSIAICELNGRVSPSVKLFIDVKVDSSRKYLVDGLGELLLVSRYISTEYDPEWYTPYEEAIKFTVFRFDMIGRKWVSVTSLDDKMLFVGKNSSFALLTSDYPGCKGNRIFYSEYCSGDVHETTIVGEHDVGVYNLADGTKEVFPRYERSCHCPIWITPSL